MVFRMKTTVDLPEDLVIEAKTVALSRKTTLKNMVMRGLRREIQNPSPEEGGPLDGLLELESGLWKGTDPDAYVKALREDWK